MKDENLCGCTRLRMEDMENAFLCGFDYVEFMGKYLVSLSEQEFAVLQKQMESYPLKVYALNAYCPPEIKMTGDGFDLQQVKAYAAACAKRAGKLGVRFVGIGSPRSRSLLEGYDRTLAIRQMKDFLKATAEEFGHYGITVCVEPLAVCYSNFINYVWEAVRLVEELDCENIKAVIDFYNMEHMGEGDLDLRKWMPYIAHAHISDDDGAPDMRSFFRLEKKTVHRQRIRRLYKNGYTGAVSVEVDIPVDRKRAADTLQVMRLQRNFKNSEVPDSAQMDIRMQSSRKSIYNKCADRCEAELLMGGTGFVYKRPESYYKRSHYRSDTCAQHVSVSA